MSPPTSPPHPFHLLLRSVWEEEEWKLVIEKFEGEWTKNATEWSEAKHLSLVCWIRLIFLLSLRVCLTVQWNNNMMGVVKRRSNWKKEYVAFKWNAMFYEQLYEVSKYTMIKRKGYTKSMAPIILTKLNFTGKIYSTWFWINTKGTQIATSQSGTWPFEVSLPKGLLHNKLVALLSCKTWSK